MNRTNYNTQSKLFRLHYDYFESRENSPLGRDGQTDRQTDSKVNRTNYNTQSKLFRLHYDYFESRENSPLGKFYKIYGKAFETFMQIFGRGIRLLLLRF